MRCTIPAQGGWEQDTDFLGQEHVPSVREDLEIGGTQVRLLLPLGFPWCYIAEALVHDSLLSTNVGFLRISSALAIYAFFFYDPARKHRSAPV